MATINNLTLNQEVLQKYSISNNAFVTVSKPNPMDKIEVEVGDTKQPDTFYPQVKIQRWDNESNVSIRLIDNEVGQEEITTDADKIVWDKGNISANFYEFSENDGGYEFNITLKQKPITNKLNFSLQIKDAVFHYQRPFTNEEVDNGFVHANQNVIGSYAVYSETPKDNIEGGKEYKVGKIGHIFRPKIEDSTGDWVWGELHIEDGILTVTIPQDFLDKAVYPVRHAAGLTFGYTSRGETGIWSIASGTTVIQRTGTVYSPASTGTCSSLTFWGAFSTGTTGTVSTKVFINQVDSVASGQHGQIATAAADKAYTTTPTEFTFTLGGETVTSGVNYILSAMGDGADLAKSDAVGVYYDTIASNNYYVETETYASPENPFVCALTGTNLKASIYVTYTAAGGTPTTNFFPFFP